MKKTIVFNIIFLFSSLAWATDPAITGLSGTFTSGQSVTITGSNFGTKSPVAPMLWDTFDSGTNGADLSGVWNNYYPGEGNGGLYSNSVAYSGTLSAYNDPYLIGGFNTSYYSFDATDTLYVSHHFYWTSDVTTRTSFTGKSTRITCGADYYSGDGMVDFLQPWNPWYDEIDGTSTGYWCTDHPSACTTWQSQMFRINQWDRVEAYRTMSSPAGTANGRIIFTHNWVDKEKDFALITRPEGQTYQMSNVLLGLMAANTTLSADELSQGRVQYTYLRFYIDDFYMDNTYAHVEVCPGSTWATRTKCDIQIPHTTWNTGEIKITVNRGSFGTTDSAYLYVIDADGNASDGYAVTFGDAYGSTTQTISGGIDFKGAKLE